MEKLIPRWHKGGKKLFPIQSILSYNLKVYGSRNNHARRFAEIPSAVIGRSKGAAPTTSPYPKAMAKKFRSKKDARHLSRHIAKSPDQKCIALPKDWRLNVL
jgi:hypothetical protein